MTSSSMPKPELDRSVLAWLAAAAAAGDERALRRLLERLQRPLRAFLWRSLGNRDDEADAWQETALAISAGVARLKDTKMVRAWAFRIARNKITDTYRARERAHDELHEDHHAAPEQATDRTLFVRQMLARLPAADQDVLYGFYHLGLSIHELALTLGSTPGAVRVRLFRARERLRNLIEGESDE